MLKSYLRVDSILDGISHRRILGATFQFLKVGDGVAGGCGVARLSPLDSWLWRGRRWFEASGSRRWLGRDFGLTRI